MFKRLLLAVLAGGFMLTACAADTGSAALAATDAKAEAPLLGVGVDQAAVTLVRSALAKLAPGVQLAVVNRAPLPGFYQVIASGQLVYISTDGKYLLNGDLVDLDARKSLNDDAWASYRKVELAKVPAADRISYAAAKPRYRVTVFTDVDCPYCHALHDRMDEYTKAGIAVDYLAWPRTGVTDAAGRPTATYRKMVAVWCAADRKAAFTAAKNGQPVSAPDCKNPVRDEFKLGERLGVSGTPAIFTPGGHLVGGYLTPEQLLAVLQKEG
ncbi:MAG: DsbC family protein [Rhodanobacter sp.]|nr:MAG: DsbC family protein [Rhodanobacter sp.]TAM08830.1 MAG: DsbC family protein [Rhodanobacter sp.]TAM36872.1 MAG: DsbC family protein [Rhodanobacter sp.]